MNLQNESKKSLIRFLFTTVLVFGCLSFGTYAQAQDENQEVLNAFVILNEQPLSNPAWVEYNESKENQSLLHTDEIIDELKSVLSDDIFKKLEVLINSEKKISFADLNKVGIKTLLNMQSLNLELSIDVQDKKMTEVLLSGQSPKNEISDLYTIEPFSGYVNLRSSFEFLGQNEDQNNSNLSSLVQAEGVLNYKGVVFESQYIYSDTQNTLEGDVRRTHTRVVYDFQKSSNRLTLGDFVESTRGFQLLNFGAGINFRKEFAITPNLFRSSFKRHRFNLDSDSMLEILVNGRLVKRVFAKQGPVELSDFPFISGENEVQVKVTDAFGNIKNLNYSDINDSRILPKGFSDYNFSLFFNRKNLNANNLSFDDEVYDFKNYNLNGYYHYGLFKNTVIGLDWQYSQKQQLFGIESIYGREEGFLKLNVARSKNEDLNLDGHAIRAEYENLLFKDGKLSNFNFLTGLEYRSKGFTTTESIGFENRELVLNTSVGQNFRNAIRGSLGFSKEWSYNNKQDRNFLTSNFGWSIFRSFDLSANIRFNLDSPEDSSILFSLNWYSRDNNQQSTSTYDPINKNLSTEYVNFPIKNRQNFRTFTGGEVTSRGERFNLGFDYFNQRADYRMAHSSLFLNNGSRAQNTQLSLSTGLAFTGSAIALTRPVDNAFVLVSMPDKPKGFSIPIGRGLEQKRGEINGYGPASVTNLAPYFLDRINLDIAELPYGYNLDKEVFSFYPSYRGGVHVKVGVSGEVSINGRAVFNDDSPAAYITGRVYVQEDKGARGELKGEFFTGSDGDFSVESLTQGNYILVFESEDKEYQNIIVRVDRSIGIYQIKEDLRLF